MQLKHLIVLTALPLAAQTAVTNPVGAPPVGVHRICDITSASPEGNTQTAVCFDLDPALTPALEEFAKAGGQARNLQTGALIPQASGGKALSPAEALFKQILGGVPQWLIAQANAATAKAREALQKAQASPTTPTK